MNARAELTREMGCTRAEFERWLPGATRCAPVDLAGDTHRIHIQSGIVEIRVNELGPRRIASISLPVLSVSFRFIDISDDEREAFLGFFDLYTRRGGG
jgi:hypothetical protein